jgi:hypothetical protein
MGSSRVITTAHVGAYRRTRRQATALVNEPYLRLIDVNHVGWQNRAHFFAMSARAMRRILVDSAGQTQR